MANMEDGANLIVVTVRTKIVIHIDVMKVVNLDILNIRLSIMITFVRNAHGIANNVITGMFVENATTAFI
jgi:hypothetical protein